MRPLLVLATLGSGAVIALACGSFGSETGREVSNGADAGLDGDLEVEAKENEFACGPARCVVGRDVCCVVAGGVGAACQPASAGCAGLADAGGDAQTPAVQVLACLTYRNCDDREDCCWSAEEGSSCKDRCSGGERPLCRTGNGPSADSCGRDEHCEALDAEKLPDDVGTCERDQGGESSGCCGGGGGGRGGP